MEDNAKIVDRHDINHELAIFKIAFIDGGEFAFEPGQYCEIALPKLRTNPDEKLQRRQYSIASDSRTKSEIELYIVRVDGGFLTPELWKLKVGDTLWLNPKSKGKFTLETVPPHEHMIFVSTGTGLAPFVSMLRSYSASAPWKNVAVVHGVRQASDLGYCEQLQELAEKVPGFHYLPVVSRDSNWNGLKGRATDLFRQDQFTELTGIPIDTSCQFMLCGNPAMCDEMEALLNARGLKLHKKKEPGNLHLERYW